MIVGRIDRRSRSVRDTVYLVECTYCRAEYRAEGDTRGELIARLAMCPDCRNDSGRRERASHARSDPSPFHVKPRELGIVGAGLVVTRGASSITVEDRGGG